MPSPSISPSSAFILMPDELLPPAAVIFVLPALATCVEVLACAELPESLTPAPEERLFFAGATLRRLQPRCCMPSSSDRRLPAADPFLFVESSLGDVGTCFCTATFF